MDNKNISRRNFLMKGGLVLGGTIVIGQFGCKPIQRSIFQMADIAEGPAIGLGKFDADFWIEILADNTILLKSPKVEMGQGVFTGAALLAAEELDMPVDRIKVTHAIVNDKEPADVLGTGGSSSTGNLFVPVREAAAMMREALKKSASSIWNVSIDAIETNEGFLTNGDKKLSYYEITQQTKKWKIPNKAPKLKPHSEFKYIGTEVKRVDLVDKVMGKPIFAVDYEIEGMLYASVVESPYLNGKIAKVDTKKAEAHAGVEGIFVEGDVVIVVAKNRYVAEMSKRKIEVAWQVDKKWEQQDIEDIVQVGKGKFANMQKEGNVQKVLDKKDSGTYIEQEYFTPAAAHAQMEPKGAIAHYKDGKMLVITGTQQPLPERNAIAKALGLKKEKVEVRNGFLGGGFGGKFYLTRSIYAAKIAKKMGKPIHLLSSREHEFMNGYYRPSTHHIMKAKISKEHTIQAMQHDIATGDMIFEYIPPIAQKLLGADPSSCHGALIEYNIEHRVANAWRTNVPYITGIWRGVGILATTFAKECFMDEIAQTQSIDPFELRKKHLTDMENERLKNLKGILEKVEKESGWKDNKPKDIGRGMACALDRKTAVAAVAEVIVKDHQIKVTKFTLGIDCGLVVNPDGVRMQCEGAIMMGLSSTLYEGLYLQDGKVAHSNFHQYPVATLKDTPEIKIVFADEQGEEVFGVGEPPIAPVAAAIANAVFDLTGKRLRRLPLNLEGDSEGSV